MLIVRNVFRLKFGQAQPVIALWKEGLVLMKKAGVTAPTRAMTDAIGEFYTFVIESEYASLSAIEDEMRSTMGNAEWKQWYQKFVPLVESGYREVLTVIE